MITVWSFWSKPFKLALGQKWKDQKHMFLSWILSFEEAKRHYPYSRLYTDDYGIKCLVEGLRLDFSEVRLTLNDLEHEDPTYWSAGKFLSYLDLSTPFVHLDYDVFLFKVLPDEIVNAPVFAQSEEPFLSWGGQGYRPQVIEALIDGSEAGWLPKEWRWYRKQLSSVQKGVCCGIFGGNDLEFIHCYARSALKLLRWPGNRNALITLPGRKWLIMHVEQYLLSAYVSYYQFYDSTRFPGLEVRYLLDYRELPNDAANKGFVHLIGQSKNNELICEKLERRVRENYPARYEQLTRYLRDHTDGESELPY